MATALSINNFFFTAPLTLSLLTLGLLQQGQCVPLLNFPELFLLHSLYLWCIPDLCDESNWLKQRAQKQLCIVKTFLCKLKGGSPKIHQFGKISCCKYASQTAESILLSSTLYCSFGNNTAQKYKPKLAHYVPLPNIRGTDPILGSDIGPDNQHFSWIG